jgi:hypothetical protein
MKLIKIESVETKLYTIKEVKLLIRKDSTYTDSIIESS